MSSFERRGMVLIGHKVDASLMHTSRLVGVDGSPFAKRVLVQSRTRGLTFRAADAPEAWGATHNGASVLTCATEIHLAARFRMQGACRPRRYWLMSTFGSTERRSPGASYPSFVECCLSRVPGLRGTALFSTPPAWDVPNLRAMVWSCQPGYTLDRRSLLGKSI